MMEMEFQVARNLMLVKVVNVDNCADFMCYFVVITVIQRSNIVSYFILKDMHDHVSLHECEDLILNFFLPIYDYLSPKAKVLLDWLHFRTFILKKIFLHRETAISSVDIHLILISSLVCKVQLNSWDVRIASAFSCSVSASDTLSAISPSWGLLDKMPPLASIASI